MVMAECPGFIPSLWQPKKCIHCFKMHGPNNSFDAPNLFRNNSDMGPIPKEPSLKDFMQRRRSNSLKNTPHSQHAPTSRQECLGFVPQKWRPAVCLNCFGILSEHKQPSSISSGSQELERQPSTQTIQPPTSPSSPISVSAKNPLQLTVTVPTLDDDDDYDDPFKDFEDLVDTPIAAPSTPCTPLETTSGILSLSAESGGLEVSSQISISFESSGFGFVKYTELEEEWDDGVDITSLLANGQYSYVNNKISEIASVKEEMQRTQQQLDDNPAMILALVGVLQAKQLQIQKAFERDKINQQDQQLLLNSLSEVRTLLLDLERVSLC